MSSTTATPTESRRPLTHLVVRIASLLIAAVGIVGFLSGFLLYGPTIEFPNDEIADIAVLQDGSIATANPFFGVIQVFGPTGRFVRGWTPTASGGSFCLEEVGHQLWSYSARGNLLQVYNVFGRQLSVGGFHDSEFDSKCHPDSKIASTHTVFVSTWLSFKDGRVVELETRWWHHLLPGSSYSWMIFAIGLLLNPDWRRGVGGMLRRSYPPKRITE